jgi:uncharacterized membrane protein
MSDVPPNQGQQPQQPGQQPPPQQPQQPGGQQPPQHHQPQQQYQQPQGGPPQQQFPQPQGGPPQQQGSGDGLDPKLGGLLAYLFGWITGLIMFLTQKHPEVRFHGAQSILLNIALFAFWVVYWIVQTILSMILGLLGAIFFFLSLLIGLAFVALWVFMLIKGYNLEHYKLPVIGDMAEKWASN